jgi:hypothetical protein
MKKEYLQEIQCPKCRTRPKPLGWFSFQSWVCDKCNHSFDTFKFHGKCPKCQHQHKETMCLTCEEVSNHLDFYPEFRLVPEKSKPKEVVKKDIFTQEKYQCPQCSSIDFLKLMQNNKSEYIYACINDSRVCNFNLNTYITNSHKFLSLDVSYGGQLWEGNNDRCNNNFNSHLNTECLECINSLKISMLPFLTHLNSCTWGACYNTMFSNVISPYFDDIEVLKFFLKQHILFNPGTYKNKNGYFMYSDLGSYLKRINCSQVKHFLNTEFGFPNDDLLF